MHPFVQKRDDMKRTLEMTLSTGTHHTTCTPLGAHVAELEHAVKKLPDGFILNSVTTGFRPQQVDSFVMAKTLRVAFEAAGIPKPDIKNTREGVWVNAGTVERIYDAHITAQSKGTPDPVTRMHEQFVREIAWTSSR